MMKLQHATLTLFIAALLVLGATAATAADKPPNQGFDHYFGLPHNLDPVETVYFKEAGGVPLMRNGKVVKRPVDPAELTAAYTDEAISFMRANKNRPFFLYLPHTMAHVPMAVTFQNEMRTSARPAGTCRAAKK